MAYVTATYTVKSPRMKEAAKAIARGQSVGNPNLFSPHETPEFLKRYAARAKADGNQVEVRFPARIFSRSGMNHILSVLMGGQMDIDIIESCKLNKVDFSHLKFPKPRYGIEGIRKVLEVYNRPLVGGIVKPKIGLNPERYALLCREMAKGGADFIKEDEILNDQAFCSMRKRIPAVVEALQEFKVLYAPCITADGSEVRRKARLAQKLGANALHLNIHCSMGAYLDLRKDPKCDLPIFFQKSGDKIWSTGQYSIDYNVICQLANLAGCDFAHVGMYGGYMAETVDVLSKRITALGNTIPSFSCGMTPELAGRCKDMFGHDVMVTSGGWIHSQPEGVAWAVKKMREAVD